MNIQEIKNLMAQFDASSLREFSFKSSDGELLFSKNEHRPVAAPAPEPVTLHQEVAPISLTQEIVSRQESLPASSDLQEPEGEVVDSPLVGVAYLAAGPDKPPFVTVGDSVKKGQTLLIVEAMKVMNEIPAPCDGIVTEILVANEDVVEFGQGLVRIK
ncbi:TPA: acetyl-CoA carboxylase biotin carboxyl carrier protein [Streptococcus equi subsp. zooepidemicus]|nr:acetyl-CoA carboxylase biotin carboxyl carrier protein [Streptococcus equi subsp. zooepidemicus]HEL1315516.1 acetyl-CoA carboxylase biotin carboxyl carrier protein [Streptococcus equi subsp. zooepidemicus]